MKATSQRMQEGFRMSMDNGETKREKVMDTLNIAAWFTNEIPDLLVLKCTRDSCQELF